MAPPALPVTIVGGYLGAGKTTLVNHLLRHSGGRRIAVAVNEFGSIPIDQDLIVGAEGDVLALSGGCICCSIGSDLIGGLGALAGRASELDCILIEASGVALPGAIAQSLSLIAGLAHDATVVLVDCETFRGQIADRYIGDTIARQIAQADLVVVNKTDLAPAPERETVLTELRERAPAARIIEASFSRIPADVIFGLDRRGGLVCDIPESPHETSGYSSVAVEITHAVDVDRLCAALASEALGLLRAKGFARDIVGDWKVVQLAGRRASATSMPQPAAERGRLVCIARGRTIERADIERLVADCAV
jgi:G3E family GTPase